MRFIIILFLIFIFHCPYIFADIYKYVDENGVICYTDAPLDKNATKVFKEKTNNYVISSKANYENTSDYQRIIHEKAEVYDIDPSLIKAIIETESNWNCMAISRKGAMGLMQLMPSTARELNIYNPFNPEENIEGGIRYLKYLIERFKGDLTLALAAYNAGPKAVEKYGIIPPYKETRLYVNKVLSLYNKKTFSNTKSKKYDDEKQEKIYKVILEDGSILFTNSSFLIKNSSRF